ncbi:sodium-dependent glucose transporter 1-like [Haliotis rubra]|uniref:sodium-dependent glucose transporter 1-like n=1 Tax=Haliotis rubra TaxID=36100 RepID=UPI001EE57E8C|nr:sodium-dependent glucose transporter 1-like [Haliotis rubra]
MEDRKYLEMLVLFSFTLGVGLSLASIGPVLPDLQCLWNVDLHTTSLVFLFIAVGTIVGVVVSSVVMDKLPAFIFLAIVTIIRGVTMFLFPYTGGLALAGPVVFIYGASLGLSAVGSLYTTNLLWPTRAGTIHLVQSGVAIGATLSPLLEKPFLSDGTFTAMMQGTSNNEHFSDKNATLYRLEITESPDSSLAMLTGKTKWDQVVFKNTTLNDSLKESQSGAILGSVNLFRKEANHSSSCDNFKTYLDYPFIFFGCITIPVTVGLIICHRRGNDNQNPCTNPYTSIDKSTDISLSRAQNMFIILMCFLSVVTIAIPGCVSNLLATFGTKSDLKLNLNTTSTMTSVFWLCYSIGRIIPYFINDRIRTFPIIAVAFVGMTAGIVVLFLSLYYGTVCLWISMIFLGLATGPHFSSLFTWTREYVSLSSKNISLLSLGANAGVQFQPLISGLLMDRFGPNSFVYSIAGVCIIHLFLFLSVTVCTRYIS